MRAERVLMIEVAWIELVWSKVGELSEVRWPEIRCVRSSTGLVIGDWEWEGSNTKWLHYRPSVLGQPKQQVDVTQADDGNIQSEFIDGQLSNGSHLMMGISKEKSLRTHHQWGHQYIHASGATLDNKWTYNPSIFGHGFPKTEARILGFGDVGVQNTELVSELILKLISELLMEFTNDQTEMIKETVVEAIAGTIMAMIAELTGDWVGDWIGNQSEMISELVSELIPELISDPDGCPLTICIRIIVCRLLGSVPKANSSPTDI